MRFPPRTILLVLIACCWAHAATGRAQELPFGLQIRASFAADVANPTEPAAAEGAPSSTAVSASQPASEPTFEERQHKRGQDRARRLLAAGIGFTLSAAITPAYVLPHRQPCWGSQREKGRGPLIAAGVVGAVGVALAVGGGTWLGISSRRHRHAGTRRKRLIDFGVGALTFALSQAVLAPIYYVDQICNT